MKLIQLPCVVGIFVLGAAEGTGVGAGVGGRVGSTLAVEDPLPMILTGILGSALALEREEI